MALHLHVWGPEDGQPLVCLHGVTGHGERFRRLAGLLPGRRVLAPDLRGHGRSTWAPPWTTEQHVEDVLATVPDGRADWIGFSFGGRIATALAAAAPGRVRRLVLLDPALTLPAALAQEHAERTLEPESYADAEAVVEAQLAGGTLFRTARELLEEDVAQHFERGPDGRLSPRVSRAMTVTAWSEMARPAPPRPAVPTLVVTGARSWVPVDLSAIGPERHVEVRGGHNVLWEDLEAVAEAVARFLP